MVSKIIKNKRIVVTGAAGFIGSHIVDKMLEMDNYVVGIDNFYNGRKSNLSNALKSKKFTLLRGDIRDSNFLSDNFKEIDLIFHEAAFTSVPQSVKMPLSCNQVNVEGVLNVLNAARLRDVEKVVFASSSSVYGDMKELPKREDMPTWPISPYGVSKQAGESYFRAYHEVYGMNTTALRYFNVFGPRQRDSPYSGVIAIFFGKIARGEPLVIFGDGEQSRDFSYIKDIVKANVLAVNAPKSSGEVINIAAGSPITVNGLAQNMLEITAHEHLEIKHLDPRPGDIKHSFGDLTKAKDILDYTPDFNVKTGLLDYLHYLDENFQEIE